MGMASLIFGVLSAMTGFLLAGFGWAGPILGIIGILLGAIAKNNGEGGIATIGMIASGIGIALTVLQWFSFVSRLGNFAMY